MRPRTPEWDFLTEGGVAGLLYSMSEPQLPRGPMPEVQEPVATPLGRVAGVLVAVFGERLGCDGSGSVEGPPSDVKP